MGRLNECIYYQRDAATNPDTGEFECNTWNASSHDTYQFSSACYHTSQAGSTCPEATLQLGQNQVSDVQSCANLCWASDVCRMRNGNYGTFEFWADGECKTWPSGTSACSQYQSDSSRSAFLLTSTSMDQDYVKEKANSQCTSNTNEKVQLPDATSPADCARKCTDHTGANGKPNCGWIGAFSFGTGNNAGKCWSEGRTTASGNCTGWSSGASFDFYQLWYLTNQV